MSLEWYGVLALLLLASALLALWLERPDRWRRRKPMSQPFPEGCGALYRSCDSHTCECRYPWCDGDDHVCLCGAGWYGADTGRKW